MNIYNAMNLPTAARIDRVVAKRQFYDNGDLSAADKKVFDHVEKIYWRYALKTENTFLQPFADEERDYSEIEVMEVILRDVRQLNRLAEIIMRAIPYAMLLFFRHGEQIQMRMGKLRKNMADSSRMTLTAVEQTAWLAEDDDFWDALALGKAHAANFCTLYEAWFDTVSRCRLACAGVAAESLSGDEARAICERLGDIEKEIGRLRSRMKRESQFNRKLELNTRLQALKRERMKIMEQRSDES